MQTTEAPSARKNWITRTVVGIVLATFFSDFSHEMCTAVLPLYLANVGLGPAALGMVEGIADFLVSMSKLAGGVAGHHVHRKRPLAALGYLVTTLSTASLAFASSVVALVSLRSAAWIARGFRGPLRDHMLADAVLPTHFARVYGLERAGDMLGAVAGPLVAALLLFSGLELRTIIVWTLIPGLLAAGAMFFLTRDSQSDLDAAQAPKTVKARVKFPRTFKAFLVGVLLFGVGDFSRTFLIWLAARALGEGKDHPGGVISIAVVLYAIHNLVAALSAYPVGRMGDRGSKRRVLVIGYAIGVGTNLLLAFASGSIAWLAIAVVLSGIYISVEETLEKAVAAELLPRDVRSLGFGVLACANAVGDMVSSLYVGALLGRGQDTAAFGLAAVFGALGVAWMMWIARGGGADRAMPNAAVGNA